jgi:endonuclease YncB( thermonuclease family)
LQLDTTRVCVSEHGWRYLKAMIDCCTREIIACSLPRPRRLTVEPSNRSRKQPTTTRAGGRLSPSSGRRKPGLERAGACHYGQTMKDANGRWLRRLAFLSFCALVFAGFASVASGGVFTKIGTVIRVVDGDTIVVTLVGGSGELVRLIGIDAPEIGDCYASQATFRVRQLAQGRRVTLKGDPTQETHDRYRRLLAYVWLPGGKDLGFQLIAGGFAHVFIRNPYARLTAYRRGERQAQAEAIGLWHACGKPT